jgi:hypothetical protein
MSDHVNKSLIDLWDAATALHDLIEKATSIFPVENAKPIIAAIEANASIIEAIEVRWGKDIWERHRNVARPLTQLWTVRDSPGPTPIVRSPFAPLGASTTGRYAFAFLRDPASLTPSAVAFCRVALSVRLSLRATTPVFVFSRTSVFNMRTSSFVQGRGFAVFFAILVSSVSACRTLHIGRTTRMSALVTHQHTLAWCVSQIRPRLRCQALCPYTILRIRRRIGRGCFELRVDGRRRRND